MSVFSMDDWGFNPANDDEPKINEVEDKCGLCGEKFDHELDTWRTTCGDVKVCAYCFDYNSQNETKILIELINQA